MLLNKILQVCVFASNFMKTSFKDVSKLNMNYVIPLNKLIEICMLKNPRKHAYNAASKEVGIFNQAVI